MAHKRFQIFLLVTIFVIASSVFHSSNAWAGCPGDDYYTVTASAGSGGTISPSGSFDVEEGGSISFMIYANPGYSIQNVTVDGASVGTPSNYSFNNVTANHSISATFTGASNQAPVIRTIQGDDVSDGAPNPKILTFNERSPLTVSIVANDADVANNVTQSLTNAPAGSTFTGTPANPSTYTFGWTAPTVTVTTNYNFTVTGSDGSLTDAHDIRITVMPVNDPPTANSQAISTPRDIAKSITLTGSDPEGSALTFNIVTIPTNGTLSGAGANKTYTPDTGFAGSDSFTFTVTDSGAPPLTSASATVSIDVTDIVLNNSDFEVQQLPNSHSLITAPDLPPGQTMLFLKDQIVEVKRVRDDDPGTPSFKFVQGTSDSFTLNIISSSAPPPASPAANYVIERYTPVPLTRPDGKVEDIGQSFSVFGYGTIEPAGSTTTGGNFTVTGLTVETDYCFRVKAVSSTGRESAHSQVKCGKTLPPPPA